jgi:hypothetical protein
VYRLGAAGEDDAARVEFADRFIVHVERVQFAVHADFAHAAGDQLGVLGTEIEDQDAVSVNVEGHDSISSVEIGNDAGLFVTAPFGKLEASAYAVVRGFFGDLHVMHVGLGHAGTGDAHELRLGAHLFDGCAAGVAHGRTQAAHQLVDDRRQGAFVRHAAFDAFRNQLLGAAEESWK